MPDGRGDCPLIRGAIRRGLVLAIPRHHVVIEASIPHSVCVDADVLCEKLSIIEEILRSLEAEVTITQKRTTRTSPEVGVLLGT